MMTILEALDIAAEKQYVGTEWRNPAWKQYVETGDPKLLFKLPTFSGFTWRSDELLAALPSPDEMDIHGKRFLTACHEATHPNIIGEWLRQCTAHESSRPGEFAKGCELLVSVNCPLPFLAVQVTAHVPALVADDGTVLPAGTFLLSLEDAHVLHVIAEFAASGATALLFGGGKRGTMLTSLFAVHAPKRWKGFLDMFAKEKGWTHLPANIWTVSLDMNPDLYLEPVALAYKRLPDWERRFDVGAKLAAIAPERFDDVMQQICQESIDAVVNDDANNPRPFSGAEKSALWLLERKGPAAIPTVAALLTAWQKLDDRRPEGVFHRNSNILDAAVKSLGREALPLLDAAVDSEQPPVQFRALELLIAFKEAADADTIADYLRRILTSTNGAVAAKAVRLASELCFEAVEKDIWATLGHKSRQARDAAAMTLATLGDARLHKAKELWAAKKADARIATVAWLRALKSPGSTAELKARLEVEENDDVRDAILIALQSGDGDTGMTVSELNARIEKTVAKLDGSPASWLDPAKLPAAKLTDGSKLSPKALLYLLYRQSRVKDMRADVEATALYSRIDRGTAGDLALAVLKAFFASKCDADDRWAMAFAALIGDDRLVPVFIKQVKDWAEGMRGKLAEYAVQAMALLGTDPALVAVDSMAIRYRSKNKNIGKAASEAFALAAEARGLTVEELGDLVIPWLGFESGKPRIVTTGKTETEVRIANDFKLAFRDVTTGKKAAKLPPGASTAVQAELKELVPALKEAAKSQTLRMEALLVRQFRWTRARWEELFLQHPLLRPFSQRLVWGAYDARGTLLGAFRSLDDLSLTDAEDSPYKLPKNAMVGIVHPLELAVDQRTKWVGHFADYDVVPPFPQLERPVNAVKDDERDVKFGRVVAETTLNGMTFKGRADRFGWTRGSVCDGGMVNHYVKTFPSSGVDVFLETPDMYVSIDMYTDISLGKIFFVKHGSVRTGSYVYDEPGDDQDPRLVSYADVPPIAFSEAMGDLLKIGGKNAAAGAEEADA